MNNQITSLEDLIKSLNDKDTETSYLEIMQSMKIENREFEKYYLWKDERYTRNCISRTDNYELLLICYEHNQATPIHDFDFQEAWIHPIMGRMLEEKYRVEKNGSGIEKVSSVILGTTEFSYMDEINIHRYSNIYEGRSVTLNLYVKPVKKWRIYQERSASSNIVEVSYDSLYGKPIKKYIEGNTGN